METEDDRNHLKYQKMMTATSHSWLSSTRRWRGTLAFRFHGKRALWYWALLLQAL